MKKSINEAYKVSESAQGTFTKGQSLVTLKGNELTIANVYTCKGRCAMYECVSDTLELNGFATSMELKSLIGREKEVRNSSYSDGCGRKSVSVEDIPTIYKRYVARYNALLGKLVALNQTFHMNGRDLINEHDFTSIWAANIEAQQQARKERIAKAKANNATTKAINALGIDLSQMSIEDATKAFAEALKAMQSK